MSMVFRLLKKLNPDEEKLNCFINDSFVGNIYAFFTRCFSFWTNKFSKDSIILTNLDNIYFCILLLLIFSIPFLSTSPLGILASILIAISFLKSIFTHKKFEFSAIHLPIIIYLFILCLSVGFSSLLIPSLKGLAKMLIYIGAFFSFFEFFKNNKNKIFPTIIAIAVSCSFELLFALKQMIFGVSALAGWQDMSHINAEHIMNRVFGTLKPYNPNLFAAYLLACAPTIFVSAIYAFIKGKYKLSIVGGAFALLSLATIIQTGCRGAYIGLFFGGIAFALLMYNSFKNYLIQNKNFKKIVLFSFMGLIILGILAVLLSPSILHRLESIFTLRGDSSNSYRMNVYISSLKMFMDNFWVGIGTGNTTYRLIYGLYMVTGFDALGAYNIYLEMAVESGIFAPLTFIWMMILAFAKSIKKLFTLPVEMKLLLIALLSAIIAMLFHGFFDTVWYRPQLQLIFWLYMAIIAVITMKGFAYEQR